MGRSVNRRLEVEAEGGTLRPVQLHPALRVCLLSVVALLGGCTSFSARKVVSLDAYHRIFVVQRLNENHHLDEIFVAELRKLGHEADSGPLTMLPEKTDAILTYDARWEWDFQTYLIELNMELHTTHSMKKLADANCHQPTVRPRAPEAVIHEMIDRLFVKAPVIPIKPGPHPAGAAKAPAAVP